MTTRYEFIRKMEREPHAPDSITIQERIGNIFTKETLVEALYGDVSEDFEKDNEFYEPVTLRKQAETYAMFLIEKMKGDGYIREMRMQ